MRRSAWIAGGVALGIALAGIGTATLAARGSSGTYTLPSGNPVVSGTVISTTWANNTLGDLATEVTDSLSRSGKGAMLAPLRLTDGTAAVPSLAFYGETGTGLYRAGTGNPRLAVSGTYRQQWTTAGTTVNGALAVTGAATITGGLEVDGVAYLPGGMTLTGQVTRANLPTVGHQISASSGSFTTSSGTFVDVTNLSVTLTATGRPVIITLIPEPGSSTPAVLSALCAAATASARFAIYRDATVIAYVDLGGDFSGATAYTSIPVGALHTIDVPSAGAHTYKVAARGLTSSHTAGVVNAMLAAYEL